MFSVSGLLTSLLLLTSFLVPACDADDRLLPGESLPMNETLVSDGGTFALGFFTLGASPPRRYLGIWYNLPGNRTVVWVANREKPFPAGSSVTLYMSENSNIEVANSAGVVLWSSNSSNSAPPTGRTMMVVLLDSGNLVLRTTVDDVRWQSFDIAGNTGLSGMKLWFDRRTGRANVYTSWKSPEDPSPGDFTFGIDPYTILQVMIWKGRQPYWRYNPWNGYFMGGSALLNNVYASYFSIQRDNQGANITFTTSLSLPQRFFLDHTGVISLLYWSNSSSSWAPLWSNADTKLCATYGACGPFGVCNETVERATCQCLKGFEPRFPAEWQKGNHSGGCARRQALGCGDEVGFVTQGTLKLPDKMVFLENVTNGGDCAAACWRNCSCTAYSHENSTNINMTVSRCYVWYGDLRSCNSGCLPPLEPEELQAGHIYMHALFESLFSYSSARAFLNQETKDYLEIHTRCWSATHHRSYLHHVEVQELPERYWSCKSIVPSTYLPSPGPHRCLIITPRPAGLWRRRKGEDEMQSFECIAAMTNNFSDSNKLGEGGFGKVYKGILRRGEEVAIKRLSKGSRQGQEEFKNEVALIAKLQHRNLVKLLGSCMQGEERILIYEYLHNGSLNTFLFDSTKRTQLDWTIRFNIIKGIARGLMYLHEDSRLKIVHRDLKAGNVLLDQDMNPKISDFGMARIFGGDESRVVTKRVVGTYGYMSPEYAMEGHFSVKSDVYSFGVLLLEVVSGRRNTCFHHNGDFMNLLTYAWQMWEEENVMEFLDPSLTEATYSPTEVSRCVHVALLCVQDHPNKRPLMSTVVFILENDTPIRGMPRRPMFMLERPVDASDSLKNSTVPASVNDLSITDVEGR
ncbi:hypothetical protein Taro_051809 [Colocasia esculenta]|uniref:Receptor-like serine/threonine-protein kinase n=1 Tax=Colocasia esculenta TaxID=4460 RepID=A0A843XHX9_COLES|nr:hypothetical protein [Colocasia esculenta]